MINAQAASGANALLVDGKPAANTLAHSGSTEPGEFELSEDLAVAPEQRLWQPELPVLEPADMGWAQMPAAEPEVVEVEQWLSSMLAQQDAQLQARDGAAEAEPASDVVVAVLAQQTAVKPGSTARELAHDVKPVVRMAMQTAAGDELGLNTPALQVPAQPTAHVGNTDQVRAAAPAAIALEGLGLTAPVLEHLVSSDTDAAPSNLAAPSAANTAPPITAERSVRLQGSQAQWGEQMLHALREHVDLQVNQRIQNATIRLDPPELGSLEIYLSHESGRLSVHLSAANGEVARLLQNTSERLRHELTAQNFVQVNVQVSADAQGGRQQGQQARAQLLDEQAVRAAQAHGQETERSSSDLAGNVLVTV